MNLIIQMKWTHMNMSIFDTVIYAAQISEQEMVMDTNEQSVKTGNITDNVGEFIKNGIFLF